MLGVAGKPFATRQAAIPGQSPGQGETGQVSGSPGRRGSPGGNITVGITVIFHLPVLRVFTARIGAFPAAREVTVLDAVAVPIRAALLCHHRHVGRMDAGRHEGQYRSRHEDGWNHIPDQLLAASTQTNFLLRLAQATTTTFTGTKIFVSVGATAHAGEAD